MNIKTNKYKIYKIFWKFWKPFASFFYELLFKHLKILVFKTYKTPAKLLVYENYLNNLTTFEKIRHVQNK